MQTATAKAAATMPKKAEPIELRKRVGSTMFIVNVRFNDTSKETIEDKILRLIESEAMSNA